jgi:uncharacterized protein (TIGR02757 family)
MSAMSGPPVSKRQLERLYREYNSRRWVHPDPLEFLYQYPDPGDLEVAGLIASSLAYGKVACILRSVSSVLAQMAPSPRRYLLDVKADEMHRTFGEFRHRFTDGVELTCMLTGIQGVLRRHGSLYDCFLSGFRPDHGTVLEGLTKLADELAAPFTRSCNSLIPSPRRGSACKRLHLFLRWMVRRDEVDLGCWPAIRPGQLIVPLDTHMHRICRGLNLTARKDASASTAVEITRSFAMFAPDDPVRYDFCLSRLGIRKDPGMKDLGYWFGRGC